MYPSESIPFLDPQSVYPISRVFDWKPYIYTEREMWALFPETEGKRVNFAQLGLTAKLYVESSSTGDLADNETYFLMPCEDRTLRPIRMAAVRWLTLEEFRRAHITATRLAEYLQSTGRCWKKSTKKF